MNIQKKILILNGTTSEIPIIKKAKQLGCYVVTTGNMPKLPGHKEADEYIAEDYSDYKAILTLVRENHIDGIVSCANDFGSITASYVAENMNWSGHDAFETALMLHHKDAFMEYFKRSGIPVPRFGIFDDEKSALQFCRESDFPLIVKANDLTGGKGVRKVDSIEEADEAVKNAFSLSRSKHILIEPFFTGRQQSIVVFISRSWIKTVSTSDIFCMRNPYLVQAETYPATDFDNVKGKLLSIIDYMIKDLKLVDGILSFQYIVENGTPYIIDIMRRCFGNGTLLLADEMTGFPWEEAYIMASLGMDTGDLTSNAPTSKYCGHYGVMAEKEGVLRSYSVPETVLKYVFKRVYNIHPGERINNCLNEKIENFYFRYDDFDRMKADVLEYNSLIKVIVD